MLLLVWWSLLLCLKLFFAIYARSTSSHFPQFMMTSFAISIALGTSKKSELDLVSHLVRWVWGDQS